MAKKKPDASFAGRWRIVSMGLWDQDFVNEEEEGYFEFDGDSGGSFHFGYVHGFIHGRPTTRNAEPCLEWTWEGNDEMDEAHGRGWAVVRGRELHGEIVFHGGDASGFVAVRRSDHEPTPP